MFAVQPTVLLDEPEDSDDSHVVRPDPPADPHKGKARHLADAKLKRLRKKREAERAAKSTPSASSDAKGDGTATSGVKAAASASEAHDSQPPSASA